MVVRLYAIHNPTPIKISGQSLPAWNHPKFPSRKMTPSAIKIIAPMGSLLRGTAGGGGVTLAPGTVAADAEAGEA